MINIFSVETTDAVACYVCTYTSSLNGDVVTGEDCKDTILFPLSLDQINYQCDQCYVSILSNSLVISANQGAVLPPIIFLYWTLEDCIGWLRTILDDITNMEWKSSNLELYWTQKCYIGHRKDILDEAV